MSTLARPALPALLLLTCLASGCSGIHFTRHAQLASVQATSIRSYWWPSRNYASILYRPDLDTAHPSAPFILQLPDQRVVTLNEMTPATGAALAADVAQCTWELHEIGPDNAAEYWNRGAKGSSRLATQSPPRTWFKPVSLETPPAAEFLVGTLRYQLRQDHPKKWSNPVAQVSFRTLCIYSFWFHRGQCVQVQVTRVDPSDYRDEYYVTPPANYWKGGRDLPHFIPAIGQRRPDGEVLHLLPIKEKELIDLHGQVLSAFSTG
jgi:hypothetical protein